MSEHRPDSSGGRRIARSEFLRRGAVGIAGAVGVAAAVGYGGHDVYEWVEKRQGRSDAEKVFQGTLTDSHKFMIFDGLLQIDPNARASASIFGHPEEQAAWKNDGFIVAERPIAVHGTMLRNIADYDRSMQNSVDRVLPEIHPRLMAFYEPGPGRMMFLDADANAGLITPLEANASDLVSFAHLPVSDLDIDGRELQGDVIYPYTKDLYTDYRSKKATETYSFIGQSVTVPTAAEVNNIAIDYFFGSSAGPVSFPKP